MVCTPEMNVFIWGEMQRRIKDGFNILLPVVDIIRLFGEKLKLFRVAKVIQAHHRLHLILNLSAHPDANKPSVNESTDRETTPDLLQFGRASPHTLQAVWEVDLVKGLVQVCKLDIADAYHHSTVKLSQVGEFVYVIPSAPGDEVCII